MSWLLGIQRFIQEAVCMSVCVCVCTRRHMCTLTILLKIGHNAMTTQSTEVTGGGNTMLPRKGGARRLWAEIFEQQFGRRTDAEGQFPELKDLCTGMNA